MHKRLIVYEHDKQRRARALLRGVEYLETAAVLGRRLLGRQRVGQHVVKQTRGYAARSLIERGGHCLDQLGKSLAGQRGHEYYRRIVHELEVFYNLLAELFQRAGVLFDQVPLVHDHYRGLALFVDVARYLGVLLGHAVLRVDYYQRHVAAVYRGEGADYAVPLDSRLLDGLFAANARSVDYNEPAAVLLEAGVDCVARGARDVADHYALLTQYAVDYGGLAHVRAAYHGDFYRVVVLFIGAGLRHFLNDFLQQIAEVHQVYR